MNRRITAVVISALAAVACMGLTACGSGRPAPESSAPPEQSEASALTPKTADEVADNLDGLAEYLLTNGHISGSPADMAGDMIGAKEKGYKYVFAADGSQNATLRVELYEFDLGNLNETAKAVQESVKAGGTFTVLDQTVANAYLSDSGKYLMIYADAVMSSEEVAATESCGKAVEAFRAFKK